MKRFIIFLFVLFSFSLAAQTVEADGSTIRVITVGIRGLDGASVKDSSYYWMEVGEATNANGFYRLISTAGDTVLISIDADGHLNFTGAGIYEFGTGNIVSGGDINGASATEMGYLSGLSSNAQNQIDDKVNIADSTGTSEGSYRSGKAIDDTSTAIRADFATADDLKVNVSDSTGTSEGSYRSGKAIDDSTTAIRADFATADDLKVNIADSTANAAGSYATRSALTDTAGAHWTEINTKQDSDADLDGISGLSSTGYVVRTGAGTYTNRLIAGDANEITVTNGSGVSGNTNLSIDLNKDLVTTAPLTGGTNDILVGADSDITIAMPAATTSQDGYLTQTDWDTFNGKADDADVIKKDGSVTYTGDQDFGGNYATSLQNIADIAAGGSGYYLTTNDYIEVADNDDIDVGTGDFSIRIKFQVDAVSGTQYLVNKESGGVGYGLYLVDDDLYIRIDDNSTDASAIIGTACFKAETHYTLTVTFNRDGNATAYVNGSQVGTVDISSTTATLSNAGALRIGSTTSGASFLSGHIFEYMPFTLCLDAADNQDLAIINGAQIPYKYAGASQAGQITLISGNSDNSDFSSDTGWWTMGSGVTITGGVLRYSSVANGVGTTKAFLTEGRSYRITISVTSYTEGDARIYCGNNNTAMSISSPGTYTSVLEADGTVFRINALGTTTLEITSCVVTWIGCVLDLNQSSMTPDTWYDASGNGNDGTVSGATLINPRHTGYFSGEVFQGYKTHLFHWYGDSAISKSYTTSWAHLTNGFGTMWQNEEDDGFTVSNDTITITNAGDYDFRATNTFDGDNGETISIRFYNVTEAAGIPAASAQTGRAANNFETLATEAYSAIDAGDKVILQYKGDASGTSVFKNGIIKIFKIHE